MGVREFVKTNIGQGTALAALASLIIALPDLLNFVVAGGLLAVAFVRFRDGFRGVDEEMSGQAGEDDIELLPDATVPPPFSRPEFTPLVPETANGDGMHLPIRL